MPPTAYYVDPYSVGGAASNANVGTDPTAPLLTLAAALVKDQANEIVIYCRQAPKASPMPREDISGPSRTAVAHVRPFEGEDVWIQGGGGSANFGRLNAGRLIHFEQMKFTPGVDGQTWFSWGNVRECRFAGCLFDASIRVRGHNRYIVFDDCRWTNDTDHSSNQLYIQGANTTGGQIGSCHHIDVNRARFSRPKLDPVNFSEAHHIRMRDCKFDDFQGIGISGAHFDVIQAINWTSDVRFERCDLGRGAGNIAWGQTVMFNHINTDWVFVNCLLPGSSLTGDSSVSVNVQRALGFVMVNCTIRRGRSSASAMISQLVSGLGGPIALHNCVLDGSLTVDGAAPVGSPTSDVLAYEDFNVITGAKLLGGSSRPVGPNSLSTGLTFVDGTYDAQWDLRLAPGSAGVHAGSWSPVWGIDVPTDDLNGNPRDQSQPPTMGCYA